MRPLVRRASAQRDARAARDYYRGAGADDAAMRFLDALDKAFEDISRHPEAGSPRYAHQLEIAGLRTWPIHRFPYLIFYVVHEEQVEIWRILHASRDIEDQFCDPRSADENSDPLQ